MAEPFPPPNDIHLSDIGPTHLTFSWNQSLLNYPPWRPLDGSCSTIYNVITSNCGICPNSTTLTSTTCTNITIDGRICSLAIQTVVCGNIVGHRSNSVMTPLKGIYVVHYMQAKVRINVQFSSRCSKS